MIPRISQTIALVCAALFIGDALWLPVRAQAPASGADQALYTYVSRWGVHRQRWGEIEKIYKEAQPRLDLLVANGTLVGWGNARAWVHDDGGYAHANWITATSFENLHRALNELRSVLPQPASFFDAKREDQLLRTTIHGGKPGVSGTGMLWVAEYQLKPDQIDEFSRIFENDIKPLFVEQIAAGTILSYSLNFQAVHTGPASGVTIAYILPDAAAIDKFQSALEEYGAKHPDTGPAMQATMDFTAHRDYVYELINFAQK